MYIFRPHFHHLWIRNAQNNLEEAAPHRALSLS